MNSLSILSSTVDKVIGNTPPSTPHPDFEDLRRGYIPSLDEKLHDVHPPESDSTNRRASVTQQKPSTGMSGSSPVVEDDSEDDSLASNLVTQAQGKTAPEKPGGVVRGLWRSRWCGCFRWAFSSVGKTLEWAIGSVYNERGEFSVMEPLRRVAWLVIGRKTVQNRQRRRRNSQMMHTSNPKFELTVEGEDNPDIIMDDDGGGGDRGGADMKRVKSMSGSSGSRSTASTGSSGQEILPRRSIRIRLYNEERSHQKSKSTSVKSPTSPSASLRMTKYPRIGGPPAPLLSHKPCPKTLILDLDETLIHSLAKGGRMSSGHMVEVKLDRQHAILYYVHKRPYCDEFLRKVRLITSISRKIVCSIDRRLQNGTTSLSLLHRCRNTQTP